MEEKKNLSKRAGEEAAATASAGRHTEEALQFEAGDCGSASFGKSLFARRPCQQLMVFGNIFHHNCPHLQHGINILRFADIWAQSDTLCAVVVQPRVWDKEAVSDPPGGI